MQFKGKNMPKGSIELIKSRQDEILNAAEELYQTKNFKDIILKDIADLTTFKRTSIYNYFETKEEIFLMLNKKQYESWTKDLEEIIQNNKTLSKDKIADLIAKTLEKRESMLRLMCMNHFDMEANSRLEILTEFKTAFGNSMKTVDKLLKKFCTEMNEADRQNFLYSLFPFIYGIYPYTKVNDKQKEAMKTADVGFKYQNIYEITYNCIKQLLK